ncbi:MAG: VOC family protein [Verrucomicrobiae bacterium]|nr:VOC family protein [Verrucomicrobiae bacterium]
MNHELKVPPLIPVLTVERIEDAIEFYKALGFSEVFSIPDESGRIVHAHLRKDESALFLGRLDISHYAGHPRASMIASSPVGQRGTGITLILQVEDLAAVFEFVQSRKLQVLAEPVDEYYGDRVFFFLDPFGYEWKISQPTSASAAP